MRNRVRPQAHVGCGWLLVNFFVHIVIFVIRLQGRLDVTLATYR